MRLWFSGPRIMGVRPGISIPVRTQKPVQKPVGQAVEGAFVYVVRGDHNLVKIGVTSNPRARLAQLKTASAFPIDYAFIAAAKDTGYAIEKKAREILSGHRVNGEWFDVGPEEAISVVKAASAKVGEPIVKVPDLATADRVLAIAAGQPDPAKPASGWGPLAPIFLILAALIYVEIGVLHIEAGPVIIGNLAAVLVLFWLAKIVNALIQS